jgi:nucleoside-diphosphate-sugar epimerase
MKTVLVTGGAGYVGSGFLRTLLKEGYHVICVDKLMFGGESILDLLHDSNFIFYSCDIGNFDAFDRILTSHTIDAVVHLAAIVGDPACTREPELAMQTNWTASKWLVDRCIALKIKRFAFASTCSNYGKMADSTAYVTEESALAPVSLYAELKVKLEHYLLHEIAKTEDFCPTALRFSTVYGVSPRMRFDLTVNEFTKEAVSGKTLEIFGEQFWRPYCHVRDFAGAFLTVLRAPQEKVAYNVFNVGDTRENYTKKMLADELMKQIPEMKIKFVKKDEDPRDYRVNSDKIKKELGFNITMRVPEGIAEIKRVLTDGVIQNTSDKRYYNIPYGVDA